MTHLHLPPSRTLLLVLAALAHPAASAEAQPGCDTTRVTVRADLAKREMGTLPFDVGFNLRVPVPTLTGKGAVVDSVRLRYGPAVEVDQRFVLEPSGQLTRAVAGRVPPTELVFNVQSLAPDRVHYFEFTLFSRRDSVVRRDSARVQVLRVDDGTVTARDSIVRRDSVVQVAFPADTVRLSGTPRATFANHFDLDAGVVASDRLGYWGAAMSTHVYLRRVNRDQCMDEYEGLDHLFKRVSLFAGLSLFEFDSGPEVEHLWSTGSPVVGIGLNRLPLVPIRINTGVIWLRQDDPNPLVTRSIVKRDLFVSGAIDVELRSLVAPLAALAGLP